MITRSDFFKALAKGALWDVGVAINRTNPLPLDKFSVFGAYSDGDDTGTTTALGYAKNSVIAYPGQIIAVVAGTDEAPVTTVYVIKKTGTGAVLESLGSSNAISALDTKLTTLEGQVVKTVTGDNAVKATKTGNAVTLATKTSAVEGNILEIKNDGLYVPAPEEVTIPEYSIVKDESSSDYAAVYHLTKDKVNTGVAINIPKDKFLKSATIVHYDEGNLPTDDPKVTEAGTYIKFVFENVIAPVHLNVKDLIDIYKGGTTTTIKVNVDPNTNTITANLGTLSVGTEHLKDGAVTEPKLADDAVTEAKIKDDAVTNTKIAANAVTEAKIKNDAVTEQKIKNGAVTLDKLSSSVQASLGYADSAIRKVKVNGTELTPDTNKAVDVTVTTGTANGHIAVNGVDVKVAGLNTAAYETKESFDNAIADAKNAVLGNADDTAESITVHGVKKKAEANATAITGLQNGKVTKVDNTSIIHGTLYGETVGSQGKSSTKTYNIMRENSIIGADAWSTMTTMEDGPVGKNYVPVYVAADGEQLQLLTGTPSRDLAAANKKYVDDAINTAVSSGITVEGDGTTGKYVTAVTKTNGKITITKGTPTVDLSELTDTTNILNSKANVTDLNQAKTDLTGAINQVKTDLTTEIGKKQDALDFEGVPSADNKVVTKSAMDSAISTATAGLTGAMHYVGESTTLPTSESGATVTGLTTFAKGDVVTYQKKEFVYDGTSWRELGDEGSYAVKGSIKDSDIAADAAIAQSKIDGLTDALDSKIEGATILTGRLNIYPVEIVNKKLQLYGANSDHFGLVKLASADGTTRNYVYSGSDECLYVNNITTDIIKNGTNTLILDGGGAAF